MNTLLDLVRSAMAALKKNLNPTAALDEVKEQKQRHTIRFFTSNRSFFGPVGLPPIANHFASRQTCRHYLRALWFQKMSDRDPLMSRRDRRRAARLFACLEYRNTVREESDASV